MANATLKPTGITIVRDSALKFVVNWKIADKDYGGGQQLRWRTWTSEKKYSAWTDVTIGTSATTKTITLTASNWFPGSKKPKLFYFEVEIRGKRNTAGGKVYDWSAWAGKQWKISVPNKPTMTTTLDASNKTIFSWNTSTDSKDAKPLYDVEYQTILSKECKEKDGSKLKWKSSATGWGTGTGSSGGQVTKTEDSTILAKNSYTRWVRVRSRGARGASDWRYAKHVYARPYKAVINKTKATVKSSNTTVYVNWTAASDAAHPIDEATVDYCMGVPSSGMGFPTGGTTTQGASVQDTAKDDAATFVISSVLDLDQALFVRVNTLHDANEIHSDWALVSKAKLKTPTALSVTFNSSTHKVTVDSATNASAVPDSKLALVYHGKKRATIAVFTPGSTLPSGVQCPDDSDSPTFGIYAFQGSYSAKTGADGVTVYTIDPNMKSAEYTGGGSIPGMPTNVTATAAREGEVLLTWDWAMSGANQAEISWSTNEYAWESTDEPQTYIVNNTSAASWRVSGLEVGKIWYFRIRLLQASESSVTYGEYSDTYAVDLATTPQTPVLSLSAAVISPGGELTASWNYVPTDGTQQATAEICTATVDDSATPPIVYGNIIARAQTAQHATIQTEGLTNGTVYNLCVRVTSAGGLTSAWSDPVPFYIGEPLSIAISASSLEDQVIDSRSVVSLTEMPLTITITGAGAGGITRLIVERSQDYPLTRPDGAVDTGFDGETIINYWQYGEAQIEIGRNQLLGRFDDGAPYRLIATIEDGYGQSAQTSVEFEVHWDDQAVAPTASVTTEDDVAVINVTAGGGTPAGSTCDIYRLSVDKPQLIVQGGAFGTDYVDPFPALGENAGYRCVCITADGDYITASNQFAWVDEVGKLFDNETGIINFNGESIPIRYNVKLSASWKKDFKETKYLGGTVRGDWNPAISRTSTINVTVPTEDTERIQAMRRLADWSGICHVRSQDGSSYAADIQVSSQTSYTVAGKVEDFTLTITRIKPEALDGIPYSEWVSS